MLLNNDTSSAIKSRQEGRDTLSWIERFGLHLLEDNIEEDNSRLRLTFNKKEENEVLVLRVCVNKEKTEGVISAYNCFFKTDGNGYVRFCVNDACDSDAKNLIELMEGAGWKNPSTINWWDEAFCDGKMDKVDEDTLKREITLTSEYETMNLMKFIECVQNEIGKAVSKLNIEGEKVKKVFLVEQYAMALPVKYALGRMYPNAIGNVFGFIWKYWEEEEERSWVQNVTRYHVPEELLHITLNTSPKMTVGDVVKMGEHGAIFTLPLTKDESGNCFLPTTPIFANSELKWNEITKGDVNADYSVGDLLFKRVQLSVFADGLKKIYVKNGSDVVACSIYENGVFQIKGLSPQNSEEAQKTMVSKTKQIKLFDEGKTTLPNKNKEENDFTNPSKNITEKTEEITNVQVVTKVSTEQGSQLHKEMILAEKKADEEDLNKSPGPKDVQAKSEKIYNAMNEALNSNRTFLEDIARKYLQNTFPDLDWKEKYGEALKGKKDESNYTYTTWNKGGEIEYLNFFLFLLYYENKIRYGKKRAAWWKSYSDLLSAIKFLIPVRNFTIHRLSRIVGIGYNHIFNAFNNMDTIATIFSNDDLKKRIEKCQDIFLDNYDSILKEHWKNDELLQNIFHEFNEERKKYS